MSDWPSFIPKCPIYETLSAAIPIQGSQVETWTSGLGFSIEDFTDASLLNNFTQTDSEINIKFLFEDENRQETATVEKPSAIVIKKDYDLEASKPRSLWDDYPSVHTQIDGDFPEESTHQTFGIAVAEAVDKVVQNEMTDLCQSIDVL